MGSVGLNIPIKGDASALTAALGTAKGSVQSFAKETHARLKELAGDAPISNRALWKVSSEAGKVYEETRSPQERYEARLHRLGTLLRAGAIDQDTYARATARAADTLKGTGLGARLAGTVGEAGRAIGGTVGGTAGSLMSAALSPTTLGVAGGIAAAGGIYAMTQQAADSAKQLRLSAMSANVSTTFYQNLGHAARKTGADVDTMTGAIEKLTKRRNEALSGNLGSESLFKSLGISQSELRTLSEEQLFMRVGRNITGQQANQMFGPGGQSVIPGMRLMSQGYQSPLTMTAGESHSNTQLKNTMTGFLDKTLGSYLMGWAAIGEKFRSGGSFKDALFSMEAEAQRRERQQARNTAQEGFRASANQRAESLLTPQEQRQREFARISQEMEFMPSPGGRTREQMTHSALASVMSNEAAGLSALDTPIERFRRQMDILNQRVQGREFGKTDKENIDRAARQAIVYEQEYRNSAAVGPMAGAVDYNSAASYSMVIGAQYQASQQQNASVIIETTLKAFQNLAPVVEAVSRNLGWQNRVVPWQGN